ncbi:uncharacterized protein LOC108263836 isoform X5 [Ictalurus punctatus]|uniref:Uncharacterized protein LOC108263836 isoform X5 n=1 Tax=Ictalurus punctatus TaxID=7998 RepID=A0A979ESI3_ICTPU|nr:uncharacterized protein LOC108263836 isoform X5 [Ictalurus punctatus]
MRQEHLSVPDIPEGLPLFLWINRILFFTMRAIMKLLICCVFMLFLVNVVPAAGSTTELLSCCFQQLGNRSVVYILNNTVESDFTQWTRNKNQEVQCTDLCEPGSANLPIGEKHETNQRDGGDGGTGLNTAGKAGIGVSVFIFIVIGVICGIQCYRKIGRF